MPWGVSFTDQQHSNHNHDSAPESNLRQNQGRLFLVSSSFTQFPSVSLRHVLTSLFGLQYLRN